MPLVVVVGGVVVQNSRVWLRIFTSFPEDGRVPDLKETAVSRKGRERREVQSQTECKAAEIRGGLRVGKES